MCDFYMSPHKGNLSLELMTLVLLSLENRCSAHSLPWDGSEIPVPPCSAVLACSEKAMQGRWLKAFLRMQEWGRGSG